MYRIIFYTSKPLQKDRKHLLKEPNTLARIQAVLAELALNPFAAHLDIKKLTNSQESTFRLRCGTWRILFDIDTANNIIIVYRIRPRN